MEWRGSIHKHKAMNHSSVKDQVGNRATGSGMKNAGRGGAERGLYTYDTAVGQSQAS